MTARREVRLAARTLAAATTGNVLSVLPVYLLGALAFLVRADLGFSETQLGAAVSLFFAVSAIGSTPGGVVTDRLGAARAMSIIAIGSGVALLGIAWFTPTYWHLLAWLFVAGCANAVCQPATNLALVGGIPHHRQGLALGVKQSATPAATLVGGLAVPAIGLTVGWRWAFAAVAVVAILVLLLIPADAGAVGRRHRPRARVESGVRALVVLAAAAGTCFTAVSALGAFYVESAVARGVAEGAAGLWFGFGGLVSISGRTTWGWFADRREGRHFIVVSILMVLGAAGFAILSISSSTAALLFGTVLTFGAGWSWVGLFHLAVIRQNPQTPAAATGIVQTGAFLGGVVGPLTFGAIVEHVSHAAAWRFTAGMMLVGAVLVLAGRRLLIADKRRRQPVEPAHPDGKQDDPEA